MHEVKPQVTLRWITPNAEKLIESAGRTAWKSEAKITEDSAGPFIKRVAKNLKHESILEHASASFHIVCDRGIANEFTRHRLASFTQESTRYCNYSKDAFGGSIGVVMPEGLTSDQQRRRLEHFEAVQTLYMLEIKEGVKPEIARGVLPLSLKTEFVVTANLREWLHILNLRCAPGAHPQIKELAECILDILSYECPSIFICESYECP